MLNLKSWFSQRDYPLKLIDEQFSRARSFVPGNREETKDKGDIAVLVATYHPALDVLKKIMEKHFFLLQGDLEMQAVFPRPPMVSFRNPKTIKNIVVRAKLPPEVSKKGSFKCNGRRCKICKHVLETNEFTSFTTGKTFRINFELNCNSNCLIYLLNCKVCYKQLTGELQRGGIVGLTIFPTCAKPSGANFIYKWRYMPTLNYRDIPHSKMMSKLFLLIRRTVLFQKDGKSSGSRHCAQCHRMDLMFPK